MGNVLTLVRDDYPTWQPCISGFRIGSHATRAEMKVITTEALSNREKNLIYRAVLQSYIVQGLYQRCL